MAARLAPTLYLGAPPSSVAYHPADARLAGKIMYSGAGEYLLFHGPVVAQVRGHAVKGIAQASSESSRVASKI
jgi:hypothetical protein